MGFQLKKLSKNLTGPKSIYKLWGKNDSLKLGIFVMLYARNAFFKLLYITEIFIEISIGFNFYVLELDKILIENKVFGAPRCAPPFLEIILAFNCCSESRPLT